MIVLSALRGKLDLVLDVVGPQFTRRCRRIAGRDTAPPRRLGRLGPELVERLLERGADPVRAPAHFDTPLAWAAHGSQYHELPGP